MLNAIIASIEMINTLITIDIDTFLKIVLALIMFSVGLSLKLSDFNYVLANKQLILIGLILKLLILPIIGFLIIERLPISPFWKLGTIIVLVCPGGTTSNVITYWFNGTAALTIFLTVLSGLIAIIMIPIFVNMASIHYFGSGTSFQLPVWGTVGSILFVIILPAIIGLIWRKKRPTSAIQMEKILKPISVLLLALVFIVKLFFDNSETNTGITFQEVYILFPILITINITGILVGFFLPHLFGITIADRMTIGIEMGVQNVGLALLIGGVLLGNAELIKPGLIYVLFTFWTTLIFAFLVSRGFVKKA